MNTIYHKSHSESNSFIEHATTYMKNAMRREDLLALLNKQDSWQAFVMEAGLDREEASTLREVLSHLGADMGATDKAKYPKEQESREHFLRVFPPVKSMLEERIVQLRQLADSPDKMYAGNIASTLAASSMGLVSTILATVGGILTPILAGGSILLTGAGLVLGAAATVTGMATGLLGGAHIPFLGTGVNHLTSLGFNPVTNVLGHLSGKPKDPALGMSIEAVKHVARNVRALKWAKDNPALITGVLPQGTHLVQGATTSITHITSTEVPGDATMGISLLMDVVNIVQQSDEMYAATKIVSAEKLREEAQQLEGILGDLTRIHSTLQ